MNGLQRCLLGVATLVVLASCASTEFSVPPVAVATDGSRQPGRVIWHDLLADRPQQTKTFYAELFGWEFEPLDGVNYTLIRHRGELIGGMVDQNDLPTVRDVSQWVVLMSVADVEQAARDISDGGGTLFTPPTSLGERGVIAVAADPQGAVLALLQTRDGDPPDRGQPPPAGRFLWNELWADDVAGAARFYAALTGMTVEQVTLEGVQGGLDYRVLSAGGLPRVGIRENPLNASPLWVSYLRVADEDQLEAILSRVEALGGRVLVPATARPAGGMVAVIADPSGAGVALQTWADDGDLADTGAMQ